MKNNTLAIVNPAAGFGKCAKLLGPAIDRLHRAGVDFDIAETKYGGHGTELTQQGYAAGYRRFIAVGGDGTSFEIINGLFPRAYEEGQVPTLGFLPLGTGNSFLKDFTDEGVTYSAQAISGGRTRPCDVIRINHQEGQTHYINILSLGFVSEVCVLANRRFKWLGAASYGLAVVACLAQFHKQVYQMKLDGQPEQNPPPTALLIFCNSKFTGGNMMLAPNADIADGKIEIVRWTADRFDFIYNFKNCYDGSHVNHPLIWQGRAQRIDLNFDKPIDVMVDGEVLTLQMDSLEVLPSALKVMV